MTAPLMAWWLQNKNVYVRKAGAWVPLLVEVTDGGQKKPAKVYVRDGGIWTM